MSTRDGLIKLHRFRVDEAQRKLASLEGMKADLERKARELDTTVADEQRRAIENEIGRFAYPGFAMAMNARRDNLTKSIGEIERQVSAAQEELNAAFRELKKFETAEDNRKREAAERRARRDQAESDDLTLTRFASQSATGGIGS